MLFNPKWDAEGKAESWRQVLLHAADLIDRVGWCQHTECDQNGRVCAAEALNRVALHDVAAYAVAMNRLSDFVALSAYAARKFTRAAFVVPLDYSPICASMGGHLSFHGAAAS